MIRTAATAFGLSSYVLLAGPPVLLWAWLRRDARVLYATGALGIRLGLWLTGIRLDVQGAEHLPPGAAVYAANHSSNIEPPAVFLALEPRFPHVRILYKAEMRSLPVLVWAFDLAGFVPLERANPEQSRPAVDRAADALRSGASFLIFPEGTRSRTGELLPFKKGGFLMALKGQAPIVPVTVSGGRAAMRRGSRLIWPTTVTVRFSAPVPTVGLTVDDRDALIGRVRAAMEAAGAGAAPGGSRGLFC